MRSFFQSEYFKNIATLLSGSVAVQGLLLAISPILSRLFTPADFGIFAFFSGVAVILSIVASGRLEIAIMLPEKKSESLAIFRLCIWIALGFSIGILILGFFVTPIETIQKSTLYKYRYWLAVTIFLQATIQSQTGLMNRFKNYKNITSARFFGGIGLAGVSILLGVLKFGAFGLILGKLAGQLVETIGLFFFNKKNFVLVEKIAQNSSKTENESAKISYKKLFSKYAGFAKFSTVEGLLNNIFKQIPVFALESFFTATAAGHYSWAQKIIGAPSGMFANSVGKVFYQKAVESNRKNDGSLRHFFKQNMKTLAAIILLPSILVMLLSPIVFEFAFGEAWRNSGIYAAWLMPFVAVTFVKAPLSCIIDIKNKLKENLFFEFGFLLITCLAFYLAFAKSEALLGIQLFSLGNALFGLIQLAWFYSLTKVKSIF